MLVPPVANPSFNSQVPPPFDTQHLQTQFAAALQQLHHQQEQARQLQSLGQCLVSTGQQLQASLIEPSATTTPDTRQALAQQARLLQALLASGIMVQDQQQQHQQNQRLLLQLLQQQGSSTSVQQTTLQQPTQPEASTPASSPKRMETPPIPLFDKGDLSPTSDQAHSVKACPMTDDPNLREVLDHEAAN